MRKLWFIHPISMITLAFFVAFLAASIRAQEQRPPGPEQKKMEVWVGDWDYQGDEKETPLGKKGNFSGRTTTRMLVNGYVLEQRSIEKDGEWLTHWWYDPSTKGYAFQGFDASGAVSKGAVTVRGDTWIETGVRVDSKGKRVHTRSSSTLLPDGKTMTNRMEYSLDSGKTWKVWYELAAKKSGQ